jgi:16S rRNA (guanine(527)-N(7))-methyltransferase RsmG
MDRGFSLEPQNAMVEAFKDFLLSYNRRVNLVSRQTTRQVLDVLIAESLLLKDHLSASTVIDAGSGSGLLGIPLAASLPEKRFVLVETIRKKVVFLNQALQLLELGNTSVWEGPIQEYMHHHGRPESALISRGFPKIEVLADYVFKNKAKELLLVSSLNKIKKIAVPVANIRENRYNIPSRDNLVILKLENVSRETRPR